MPDLVKRLIQTFRWIDPGPESTHLVSDMSGWWRDAEILSALGPALADPFRPSRPTVVVSPEVTGYLLGPLVATALGVGFAAGHKEGADRQIAEPVTWARTAPDYRRRSLGLGIRSRLIGPSDRVLVVDDWVTTGAQVRALYEVIRTLGAAPVGCATVVADCGKQVAAELSIRSLLTSDDLAPD
ncbi:phosphoribosyltransferase family protein [Phytohabitans sp. ZYX-F-186]|uniref:adenine phosphoribosyltransferase n=1 Tax=Phytohabitans maris TaxID=3071409 RepID=A0ABU0ZTC5_9ACTN|nr:phosphoribosyltransferase family protein [Phytohabitans sp. ZYX-F-186]MDQ7910289.1 phosphoribosyltransferase family protein [Phytohabitans sp. ZYX-F-186]